MKTRSIICAFLTLIAVGCVKENNVPSGDNNPAGGNTITVNMPELTRTAIGGETQTGVSLVWSKGDEIAVIEGKGTDAQKYSVYRLIGEGGTASGTFEYVSGNAAAEVITDVVFPASAVENSYAIPTSQTYVEGSFDTDAMVMSWTRTSTEEAITLAHEASAMMFTVTGAAEQKISSVAVVCEEKTYTLTCDEPVALSAEGIVFYVAVPGNETAQNYAVTFTSEGGETLTKDFTYALNAGKIGRLPAFAFETTPAVEPLKLGDYFGGGIVFQLTEEYAKVVSLDETQCYWAVEDKATTYIGTEANPTEGAANTDLFRNRDDLTDFPAMAWCISHGEGWYMPSRSEINYIVNGLGLSSDTIDSINQKFEEYYGMAFNSKAYYSSCENSDGSKVWTVTIPSKSHNAYTKAYSRYVRAVKKIALTGGETADPKPVVETQNLAPVADAFYSNTSSSYYRGTLDNLYIYYATSGDLRRAAYVKFNLSSLDATALKNATLNLTVYSSKCDFYDFTELTYNAYKVSNDWEEIDYTSELGKKKGVWTSTTASVSSTTITPSSEKLTFDLTDCIKSARENNETEISICIQSTSSNYKKVDDTTSSAKLYVYSRESTVEGTQPQLIVTSLK